MAIVRLALPVATHRLFDYWLPSGLDVQPGSVLLARLGNKKLAGVAMELIASSEVEPERLQPIDQLASWIPPLPEDLRALARFVSEYYQQPIGQCLALMLPPLSAARSSPCVAPASHADARLRSLNGEQRAALDSILGDTHAFAVSLLQGVTGSGKTEVYLAAAARMIAEDRQVLLLAPEINLTPQLSERIAAALPHAATVVLHSRLSDGDRRAHWLAAASGGAQLIVGTRLSVFTPLPKLGLIVVDEEHDESFKQQDGVRYHARDLAIYRARLRDVPVILGSATPSLESYAKAKRGRYRWLKLPQRATLRTALPPVRLVANRIAGSVEGIGSELARAIGERLSRREQTLIFINRRGFAPSLLCAGCGWKAECTRCASSMVLHREAARLCCHHCGRVTTIPAACPDCGNQDLLPLGFGTQRLERGIAALYPNARIVRVDRDSTRRKGSFDSMREAIAAGDVDIMIGTQMLAKGHDFPRLTLVGVLGADNSLYSAEYRATERLFALLEQVAGRAGRGACAGEVIIQTDFPDHPLYVALSAHDYDRFAATLLAERQELKLPPFSHLALLRAEAKLPRALSDFLEQAAERGRELSSRHGNRCEVFPPTPATMPRRAGLERAQVLVQSLNRRSLQEFLQQWRAELDRLQERRVRWGLDVDPLSFA